MAGARAKLARAKEIVRETSLDWKLKEVWNALSRGDLDLYDRETMSGFRELTVEELKRSHKKVRWVWEDQQYELEGEFSDSEFADLSLSLSDEEVLAITYTQGNGWDLLKVKALKIGSWMTEIVRMGTLLEEESDIFMDEIMDEADLEDASRIDLKEPE